MTTEAYFVMFYFRVSNFEVRYLWKGGRFFRSDKTVGIVMISRVRKTQFQKNKLLYKIKKCNLVKLYCYIFNFFELTFLKMLRFQMFFAENNLDISTQNTNVRLRSNSVILFAFSSTKKLIPSHLFNFSCSPFLRSNLNAEMNRSR